MSEIFIDNKELKFKEGIGRNQEILLPSRIDDYIPKDHLARLVVTICENIDFDSIIKKYSQNGQHAYDPRMMTALLFYGYTTGIRSSRKIATACLERLDFRYISRNLYPAHDRISDFRMENHQNWKTYLYK
jgi:transposase